MRFWILRLIAVSLLGSGMGCATPDPPTASHLMHDQATDPTYRTRDGENFPYRAWLPSAPPKAVLVAFHGLSGAADDFEPLADHLVPLGYAVYSPYLRSQGHDPKLARRGNHRDFQVVVDDFEDFTRYVSERHPNLPIVEAGESMGAMLLVHRHARTTVPDSVRAVILFSPVVDLKFEIAPWQRLLFRTLTTVAPGYRTKVDQVAARQAEKPRMTRDDAYQQRLDQAPHRLSELSLRFVGGLTRMIEASSTAAAQLNRPVYIAYAGKDLFIEPAQVESFARAIGSPNVNLQLYPDSYHLLLHDYDAGRVLDELTPWINARID